MELFHAHNQWANRPEDERFTSLEEMYTACKGYADTAVEKEIAYSDLRVEAVDGDVQIVGKAGVPAKLTHWAFGQLASRIAAPASYLRELPATLACQNLNHGLAKLTGAKDKLAQLLFHKNGGLLLRALTSDIYTRVWNYEIAARLIDMQTYGWEIARPDIRVIDQRLPAYASDHDLFVFMRTANNAIEVKGQSSPCWRGTIWTNSEVGKGSLGMMHFLYNEMCGNHIIWGASEVSEVKLRHVGSVREKFQLFQAEAFKYEATAAGAEELKIESAQSTLIGGTKQEVLDTLFNIKRLGIPRSVLEAGYDACVPDQDGDPNTQWGMVQGLTRHSQTLPHADKRTKIDEGAGRLLGLSDSEF